MTPNPAPILERIEQFVNRNGRPLDIARFRHAFRGGDAQEVVNTLTDFQNEDGGFGNGLEPDFLLPESSPIATWVGLGCLSDLGIDAETDIVRRALKYLQSSYDDELGGWVPVSPAVNNHPHAGWWHFEPDEGGTPIHQTPWNPTSALTGYLWHFEFPGPPSAAELTGRALAYLRDKADSDIEMHELYTFVQLATLAPEPHAGELQALTTAAVQRIVQTSRADWEGYGAQPLTFVNGPGHYLHAALREVVAANLDYWLDTLGENGAWSLPWQWGRDEDEFARVRPQIEAALAVQRAIVLRNFGRLH